MVSDPHVIFRHDDGTLGPAGHDEWQAFVEDPDDLDSWWAAVQPNTKAFFAETISNPQIDILDTPGVSGVAHEHGIPLIVDNTIATPYLIQPIAQGADIVVHSATKYLNGHSDVVAGALVGVVGAMFVRYWFAARRLGFAIHRDGTIVPLAGPSSGRLKRVARGAFAP